MTISKIFRGDIPDLRKRSRCLDPDANIRLAPQRCHCSCFTKRPLPPVHTTVSLQEHFQELHKVLPFRFCGRKLRFCVDDMKSAF